MSGRQGARRPHLKLRGKLLVSFSIIVVVLGVLILFSGVYLISEMVLREAQTRVKLDLRAAWTVYDSKLDDIKDTLKLTGRDRTVKEYLVSMDLEFLEAELEKLRMDYGLDILTVTDNQGKVLVRTRNPYNAGDDQSADTFVRRALTGETVSGTEIVSKEKLKSEGDDLLEQAFMTFRATPKAKPRSASEETSGMMLKASVPILEQDGTILGVLYGGVLLNRNYEIVDRVKDMVFKDEKYKGEDLGTATIFQWDLRVSTNVKRADGNRAIATRVSEEVYDQVLENGRSWIDRAFVVNNWYITAYDPIRDIDGKVIGMLYVGVLDEKYQDMSKRVLTIFSAITVAGIIAVLAISLLLSYKLANPIRSLVSRAHLLSKETYSYTPLEVKSRDEIGELTEAFNEMAQAVKEREEELNTSNIELKRINSNYLEMLGFVSHELKTPLSSMTLNAYSLKDGLLGDLPPNQLKVIDSISRNLTYLEDMIKNYLDLARIEKGELIVHKTQIHLNEDCLQPILDQLGKQIDESKMRIDNHLADDLSVNADPNLMKIVFDNLISNALKYGNEGGVISIEVDELDDRYQINVWNEGQGIPKDKMEMLFQRFSRIRGAKPTSKKGSGLGLFITKEIIEKHGGEIWCESEEGKWVNFIFTLPKKI
ncbi:cache domain-containing protein [Candidatus Poribacteria bacterium]